MIVQLQGPFRVGRRAWGYRSGNKVMHTGISLTLGKLECSVLNCLLLKGEHYPVLCQSVLASSSYVPGPDIVLCSQLLTRSHFSVPACTCLYPNRT
jgi:hypothetical protein